MPDKDESPTAVAQALISQLETLGGSRYGGEVVSQLDHALQCATLAHDAGAEDALVTAALLHDIGHLVNPKDEGAAAAGIDAAHETVGAAYLSRWFGPAVTAPVAQHVAAKRYLCQAEPGYYQTLSEESVRSLALQGGPFTVEEAEDFRAGPYAEAALALRRWDEAAKDPAMETPPLRDFEAVIERVLRAAA
ncbi:MAG TPA: HD domain-containing protein [Kiloniellaceae bacterium]|nr:HD domain-containing protein [Kiloniellaceae bacterium]HIP80473.1 HD domain-containing protein [Kiloniellaceae bacterium]